MDTFQVILNHYEGLINQQLSLFEHTYHNLEDRRRPAHPHLHSVFLTANFMNGVMVYTILTDNIMHNETSLLFMFMRQSEDS